MNHFPSKSRFAAFALILVAGVALMTAVAPTQSRAEDDPCKTGALEVCMIKGFKANKVSPEAARASVPLHHGFIAERLWGLRIQMPGAMGAAQPNIPNRQLIPYEIDGISPRNAKGPEPISVHWLYHKRVLSLGEGLAGMVPYLVREEVDAYGVDISDTYRSGREENLMLWTHPGQLLYGDATKFSDMKIAAKPFDLIVSSYLLDELSYDQNEAFLKETLKKLKPGAESRHTFSTQTALSKDSSIAPESFQYRRMLTNLIDFGLSEGFRVKIRHYRVGGIADLLVIQRWD